MAVHLQMNRQLENLNETSLEDALISIAGFVDERGLIVALRGNEVDCSTSVTVQKDYV